MRSSIILSTIFLAATSGCSSSSDTTPPAASAGSTAAGTTSAGTGGSGGGVAGTDAVGGGGAAGMGTGGSAGSAGSAGAAGSGGSAGNAAGIDDVRASLGCGTPAAIEPGSYVQSELEGRSIWVRLPDGYDPTRAYPLIFVWKGCGGAGSLSIFHLEEVAGSDAIIVHGDFADGMDCYDTADGAQFVDLPFFDAFLAHMTGGYCVDEAHVFSAGFSSGAWLTQFLACQRGDVLRGIGTIAGGFKPSFFLDQPPCKGNIAAFMISDLIDDANPFFDTDMDGDSVEVAVNQWLVENECEETAWTETAGTPADPDQSVCRSYAGCGDYPVKLCLTDGQGHSDQTSLSVPGFWAFFSQFLPAP